MAAVVQFKESARKAVNRKYRRRRGRTAEVIIFPGVRVERIGAKTENIPSTRDGGEAPALNGAIT